MKSSVKIDRLTADFQLLRNIGRFRFGGNRTKTYCCIFDEGWSITRIASYIHSRFFSTIGGADAKGQTRWALRRVSTDSQQTDMQEEELRSYAQARGWLVHKVYADRGISGAKNSRPALDEMWADCRKRRIDLCIVWALDRLSRSLKELIGALEKFRQLGVDFACLKQDLDTSTSGGRLLFHVIASVCEFERDLIRERTVAGMAEARRKGKHIGRPPLKRFNDAEEREIRTAWRNNGISIRRLALRFGTTDWMIRKMLVEKPNAANENRPVL